MVLNIGRAAFFILLSFNSAWGAVTVTPAEDSNPLVGTTVYYSASGLSSGFVDANFRSFDLTAGRSSGSTANMIVFDVKSDKTDFGATTNKPLVLAIYARATSGADWVEIPIAAAGIVSSGFPSFCESGDCIAEFISGAYFAATYTVSTTLRIGVYPADICSYAYSHSTKLVDGCSSTSALYPVPVTGTPETITLKFVLGTADTSTSTTTLPAEDSTETSTVILSFQVDPPTASCTTANLQNFYFPGDKQILVKPGVIGSTVIGSSAPVDYVVMAAKNGDGLVTDSSALSAGVNDVVGRVKTSSGEQYVGGFVNTTDGTDNSYDLIVSVRDSAGIVAQLDADSCVISGIQTASINGFLDQSKCFIATAAYGDPDSIPLRILRKFRDRILMQSTWGTRLVQLYYRVSPSAARWLHWHPFWKPWVLKLLIPFEAAALVALFAVWFFSDVMIWGSFSILLIIGVGTAFRRGRSKTTAVLGGVLLLLGLQAQAEIKTPYIDQLKAGLQEEAPSESYIESLKNTDPNRDDTSEGYTQKLREGIEPGGSGDSKGFTERERQKLTPSVETSAIEKVGNGTSELELKRPGKIKGLGSLHVGVNPAFSATSTESVSGDFGEIYNDDKWAPDVRIGYEYQFFHDETFGSLGLLLNIGFSYFKGKGVFSVALNNPINSESFGSQSQTDFRFFMLPVGIGPSYRFNLFKYVRPYVQVVPNIIGYIETRNDGGKTHYASSGAVRFTGGAALMLDWISRRSAFELYQMQGIKHFYLTFEYSRLVPFNGVIQFEVDGYYAGIAAEF